MNYQTLIEKIINSLKERWEKDSSGHDFYHLQRVVRNAKRIQKKEGGDEYIIEMAAWLHDSFDDKLVQEVEKERQDWRKFLLQEMVEESIIDKIFGIIDEVSYRKNKDKKTSSLEASIVQDADRLDAMGAIGIARAFAYGGSRNRLIYDDFPIPNSNSDVPNSTSTLAHFYDKLLHLESLMNTKTGKENAKARHRFMVKYLEQFYKEI